MVYMAEKLIDQYKIIQSFPEIKVPWEVKTTFGAPTTCISIAGSEISLGEDFKSLDDCRKAVEWYVDQLGGSVKWSK